MKLLTMIAFLAMMLVPTTAWADIHPGEFEIQGWCVQGPDPRMGQGNPDFDYAVTGLHNPASSGSVFNDPPHVHVDDLIHDGFIKDPSELYGRAFIFSGYWVEHEGQKHFRAYVPKDDMGLEEVSCETALQVTPDTKDQYLAPSVDTEMQREHGLGSSGQTNTEQGKRRGEE
jgi:hypothetical protein